MNAPRFGLILVAFHGLSHAFAGPLAPLLETAKASVPLESAPTQKLVSFDLEERVRVEVRSNNRDFDRSIDDPTDDSWALNRFRFGLTVKPASWLKLYGQTQDTREWGSDRPNVPGVAGTEGGDSFDLRQTYVEIGELSRFPISLTVGRFGMTYGDARLVADSVWTNFGRTFDGARVHFQRPGFGYIDAFATRPVQIKRGVINDSDSADNFFGLYAGLEILRFQTTDFYVLYRDKKDLQPDLAPANTIDPRGSSNGPAQRITTIGTRWASKKEVLGPWDYTAEFAGQFGEVWSGDRSTPRLEHRAFALAATAGYTFAQLGWQPRIGVEYDYATGDKDPDDRRSGSFQNLFPSNHARYGFMDEFSWRNLHDAILAFSAQPAKNLTATLDYHVFWLADTNDYWFRSNGYAPLRTRTPAGADVRRIGASSFAGQELDFTVKWKPMKETTVLVGYSHFFAGDYLEDTGAHDDADFFYVQAGFNL